MLMKHVHYYKVLDSQPLNFTRMVFLLLLKQNNMAAYAMQHGLIDAVIVGADRITTKGDVANKIGTLWCGCISCIPQYSVLCSRSLCTFDFTLENGSDIPIEMRNDDEVTAFTRCSNSP